MTKSLEAAILVLTVSFPLLTTPLPFVLGACAAVEFAFGCFAD